MSTQVTGSSMRSDPRLAGRVMRYHTWPHIRPQTVAEHTWQVMRILVTLWPKCPQEVLRYAISHDIGEIATGDVPYPIKAENPELQLIMDNLENECQVAVSSEWGLETPENLTKKQYWVFKLSEFIEMWEWGLEENTLGNKFGGVVASRCLRVVLDRIENVPEDYTDGRPVHHIALRAHNYVRKRQNTWPM